MSVQEFYGVGERPQHIEVIIVPQELFKLFKESNSNGRGLNPGTYRTVYKVLQGLSAGKSVKTLEFELGIRSGNLACLVSRFRRKLNLKSSYQLLAHFIRKGWLDEPRENQDCVRRSA